MARTPLNGNRSYQAGAALELKVMRDLAAQGWVCFRSAGSKSPVDVVACRAGEVAFVQSRRAGRLDTDEWNELMDLAERAGAVPVLVRSERVGRYAVLTYGRLAARKDGTRGRRSPLASWEPAAAPPAGSPGPA